MTTPTSNILLSLILVLAAGCATTPTSTDEALSEITVRHDTFKQQTWVESPLYVSRQGFTDTFPVKLAYRSLLKDGVLVFIQLYVTSTNVDWGFYHEANGEDGYSFEFTDIDSEVRSSSGMVLTEEHFGLSVPHEYLEKMATKDWRIKVYGKRNQGVFVVPQSLSQAFLQKLDREISTNSEG